MNSRRSILKKIILASAAIKFPLIKKNNVFQFSDKFNSSQLKGNINHSVVRWCYDDIPFDEFCAAVKNLGLKAIDVVEPKNWPLLKHYGLHCSMCSGADMGLQKGWNNKSYHERLIRRYKAIIPKMVEAGYTNLICYSGLKNGLSDETGWNNCVEGLCQIIDLAEKNNVVLIMEMLNSKVEHPDYQGNSIEWGVELCKKINSPNFKLLFDIYHLQIMEGNIIESIENYHPYIAHYHTAGVPDRHEIDETQELNYPAIMNAILKTGYTGYVAQEFIPTWENKIAALSKGIEICDV